MHIITMDSEIWIFSSTSTLCLVFMSLLPECNHPSDPCYEAYRAVEGVSQPQVRRNPDLPLVAHLVSLKLYGYKDEEDNSEKPSLSLLSLSALSPRECD